MYLQTLCSLSEVKHELMDELSSDFYLPGYRYRELLAPPEGVRYSNRIEALNVEHVVPASLIATSLIRREFRNELGKYISPILDININLLVDFLEPLSSKKSDFDNCMYDRSAIESHTNHIAFLFPVPYKASVLDKEIFAKIKELFIAKIPEYLSEEIGASPEIVGLVIRELSDNDEIYINIVQNFRRDLLLAYFSPYNFRLTDTIANSHRSDLSFCSPEKKGDKGEEKAKHIPFMSLQAFESFDLKSFSLRSLYLSRRFLKSIVAPIQNVLSSTNFEDKSRAVAILEQVYSYLDQIDLILKPEVRSSLSQAQLTEGAVLLSAEGMKVMKVFLEGVREESLSESEPKKSAETSFSLRHMPDKINKLNSSDFHSIRALRDLFMSDYIIAEIFRTLSVVSEESTKKEYNTRLVSNLYRALRSWAKVQKISFSQIEHLMIQDLSLEIVFVYLRQKYALEEEFSGFSPKDLCCSKVIKIIGDFFGLMNTFNQVLSPVPRPSIAVIRDAFPYQKPSVEGGAIESIHAPSDRQGEIARVYLHLNSIDLLELSESEFLKYQKWSNSKKVTRSELFRTNIFIEWLTRNLHIIEQIPVKEKTQSKAANAAIITGRLRSLSSVSTLSLESNLVSIVASSDAPVGADPQESPLSLKSESLLRSKLIKARSEREMVRSASAAATFTQKHSKSEKDLVFQSRLPRKSSVEAGLEGSAAELTGCGSATELAREPMAAEQDRSPSACESAWDDTVETTSAVAMSAPYQAKTADSNAPSLERPALKKENLLSPAVSSPSSETSPFHGVHASVASSQTPMRVISPRGDGVDLAVSVEEPDSFTVLVESKESDKDVLEIVFPLSKEEREGKALEYPLAMVVLKSLQRFNPSLKSIMKTQVIRRHRELVGGSGASSGLESDVLVGGAGASSGLESDVLVGGAGAGSGLVSAFSPGILCADPPRLHSRVAGEAASRASRARRSPIVEGGFDQSGLAPVVSSRFLFK